MAEQNPDWRGEELVLALEAWFRIKESDMSLSKDHPIIVELNDVLQKLPFHSAVVRNAEFRSLDGIRRRVSYFRQFDEGKNVRDRQLYRNVWNKYSENRQLLKQRAHEIAALIVRKFG